MLIFQIVLDHDEFVLPLGLAVKQVNTFYDIISPLLLVFSFQLNPTLRRGDSMSLFSGQTVCTARLSLIALAKFVSYSSQTPFI